MRRALGLALIALPLVAGEALHIVAVERKGWPPFEDDRRVYRIEGGEVSRLRVGERLTLQRQGSSVDPGRLKVAAVAPGYAEAYLERRGSAYPLRGDVAEAPQGLPLPRIPALQPGPDLRPAQPRLQPPPEAVPALPAPVATRALPRLPVRSAHPAEAPRNEGSHPAEARHSAPLHQEAVFFLEGDGALSPKGREKLRRIVEAWGADGAWSLGLPQDRTLPPSVREARIQSLRRALRGLGVGRLEVRAADLRPGDRGDVVYAAKD